MALKLEGSVLARARRNLGKIVWYDLLAPRPELFLCWNFVCACAVSIGMKALLYSWEKVPVN